MITNCLGVGDVLFFRLYTSDKTNDTLGDSVTVWPVVEGSGPFATPLKLIGHNNLLVPSTF